MALWHLRYYYLALFLSLLVISIAHELGHMFAYILFKVPIHQLRIGLGPVILRKKSKKSSIRKIYLRLFPFVLAVGVDGDRSEFLRLGFWRKIFILASGGLVNFSIAGIVMVLSGLSDFLQPSSNDVLNITKGFVVLNILVGLFGFLPFSKFDGGKIFEHVSQRFFARKTSHFIVNLRVAITFFITVFIIYIFHFWFK